MSGDRRIDDYVLTEHALWEMRRRKLDPALVHRTLKAPEQQLPVKSGRIVCQSRWTAPESLQEYLIRVIVDIDRDPPEVVTAYRTTKLVKYWRPGS